MILVALSGIGALVVVAMIAAVTGAVVLRLRAAGDMADQFADALDELARDDAYSPELVSWLIALAPRIAEGRLARQIGRHCAAMARVSKGASIARTDTAQAKLIESELSRLSYTDRQRFIEVMGLFLAALSYRDPVNGIHIRDMLMGRRRQFTVTSEAAQLADLLPPTLCPVH